MTIFPVDFFHPTHLTRRIPAEYMGFSYSAVAATVEIQPVSVAGEPRNPSLCLWLGLTMILFGNVH
jgi:hypothetical protein